MKPFKKIKLEIEGVGRRNEYLDSRIDHAFERINELETFRCNIILAIEQLNYGTSVEDAAKFEIPDGNTRDFLKYMALFSGMNNKKK